MLSIKGGGLEYKKNLGKEIAGTAGSKVDCQMAKSRFDKED